MTEHEKLLKGLFYNPGDEELRTQSNKAKALVKKYNQLAAEDMDGRNEILKELLGGIGKNVRINQPLSVDYGNHIFVGDDCVINMNCTLLDTNKIIIGNRVLVGPDVKMYGATHPKNGAERFAQTDDGVRYLVCQALPIIIDDDAWIGGGSIILPGIHIGSNTVIGAGSVVTKDIPANVIAVGNPCRVIGENV